MQHSFWHKVPVVRILAAFASGIGTNMFYPFHHSISISLFAVFGIGFLGLPYLLKVYHQRWISGFAGFIACFFAGVILHTFQNPLRHSHHFSYSQPAAFIIGVVDELPTEKAKSIKTVLRITGTIKPNKKAMVASGKLLLYIDKKIATPVRYGEVVIIPGELVAEVNPPKNPGEFDYKRYLAFHHIYHQAYVHAQQLIRTQQYAGRAWMNWVYSTQDYFKQVLIQYVKSKNEIGVAQALLYGFDDEINEETVSAYANTGTLHVLAVSGMHVGIIFYILDMLLMFLNKQPKLLLVKRIFILCFLWVYSLLCGFSPSILRATVMFSFIIVSQILNRRSNVYNTLAASCITLLMFDCNMLANVGFQLSYLAVLGIVFVQPQIYALYIPHNWLIDQVWKITSVSIAAQLTTSPIGLLYFHQFPNCFLFSNLLIIPLTTVILYACIVLLVISAITLPATWLGLGIYYLISFTNILVQWVEKIPYAYINGIQISIVQSILLYIALFALLFFWMHRLLKLITISLYAGIAFFILQGYSYTQHRTQQQLIVYAVSGNSAIQLISQQKSTLWLTPELKQNKQKFKFHLQQHIWQSGIKQIDTININENWQWIACKQKQILLTGKHKALSTSFKPDVLVVQHYISYIYLQQLQPKFMVITGTLSRKAQARMEQYAESQKIPYHNVLKSGAFQLSLQ
jgi:competence protein ComEC